jgi:hypothetical protein
MSKTKRTYSLDVGHSELFGYWCLEFGYCPELPFCPANHFAEE